MRLRACHHPRVRHALTRLETAATVQSVPRRGPAGPKRTSKMALQRLSLRLLGIDSLRYDEETRLIPFSGFHGSRVPQVGNVFFCGFHKKKAQVPLQGQAFRLGVLVKYFIWESRDFCENKKAVATLHFFRGVSWGGRSMWTRAGGPT